eukprot:CAMPEP_0182571874 /NCGR_PEP_ID=MMETSP1324-20130603/15345_1 /TAXON_ID=236786 /ORGANISM="Florenciella sp., Strain RCC1587" /LENGTH=99 /DNA_ID=CAMNT_0024786629 /DNA_START=111 /DNA_END=408 /DNA_ORIENTATION=+
MTTADCHAIRGWIWFWVWAVGAAHAHQGSRMPNSNTQLPRTSVAAPTQLPGSSPQPQALGAYSALPPYQERSPPRTTSPPPMAISSLIECGTTAAVIGN